MLPRLLALCLLASTLSFADVTNQVRTLLEANNFAAAEASLQKVFEVIEGTGMNRPETFVHGHLDTDGER